MRVAVRHQLLGADDRRAHRRPRGDRHRRRWRRGLVVHRRGRVDRAPASASWCAVAQALPRRCRAAGAIAVERRRRRGGRRWRRRRRRRLPSHVRLRAPPAGDDSGPQRRPVRGHQPRSVVPDRRVGRSRVAVRSSRRSPRPRESSRRPPASRTRRWSAPSQRCSANDAFAREPRRRRRSGLDGRHVAAALGCRFAIVRTGNTAPDVDGRSAAGSRWRRPRGDRRTNCCARDTVYAARIASPDGHERPPEPHRLRSAVHRVAAQAGREDGQGARQER